MVHIPHIAETEFETFKEDLHQQHVNVRWLSMDKSYGDIFKEMITMPNVQWSEVWQSHL